MIYFYFISCRKFSLRLATTTPFIKYSGKFILPLNLGCGHSWTKYFIIKKIQTTYFQTPYLIFETFCQFLTNSVIFFLLLMKPFLNFFLSSLGVSGTRIIARCVTVITEMFPAINKPAPSVRRIHTMSLLRALVADTANHVSNTTIIFFNSTAQV